MMKEYLRVSDRIIAKYQREHEGACPPDLATAFPAPDGFRDAFGGGFVYDKATCRVKLTSRPNLREEVGNDVPLR